MLYNNATTEWRTESSFTLNVTNVGYLAYKDTVLCDVEYLKTG